MRLQSFIFLLGVVASVVNAAPIIQEGGEWNELMHRRDIADDDDAVMMDMSLQKAGHAAMPPADDPLDVYCNENPDAEECRIPTLNRRGYVSTKKN